MIDPAALSKIKHLIPAGENVLWAGQPEYKLFSKYNLVYFGCLGTAGLTAFYLHLSGWEFLKPIISLVEGQQAIAILFIAYMFLIIVWVAIKPKFDSFVLTDKALYVRRKTIPFWREARLLHSNIVKVKPVLGCLDAISISYEPLKDKALLKVAIWDVSSSLFFYNRYVLHIRDVPDMEGLILLLQRKAKIK